MKREQSEREILMNINRNIVQATRDIRKILIANVIMMLMMITGAFMLGLTILFLLD